MNFVRFKEFEIIDGDDDIYSLNGKLKNDIYAIFW